MIESDFLAALLPNFAYRYSVPSKSLLLPFTKFLVSFDAVLKIYIQIYVCVYIINPHSQ